MCPRCASFAVDQVEVGVLDLEYRCTRCGHVWPWTPGGST